MPSARACSRTLRSNSAPAWGSISACGPRSVEASKLRRRARTTWWSACRTGRSPSSRPGRTSSATRCRRNARVELPASRDRGQTASARGSRPRRSAANSTTSTSSPPNVNAFEPDRAFDRIVSVEMFEHMRNWAAPLARIGDWLTPDGRALIHVFSHRRLAYRFESTWAAGRFFTAETMPSHDLLHHRFEALRILQLGRTPGEAKRLLATWRLFLISTAEIWGWRGGRMDGLSLLARAAPRRARQESTGALDVLGVAGALLHPLLQVALAGHPDQQRRHDERPDDRPPGAAGR